MIRYYPLFFCFQMPFLKNAPLLKVSFLLAVGIALHQLFFALNFEISMPSIEWVVIPIITYAFFLVLFKNTCRSSIIPLTILLTGFLLSNEKEFQIKESEINERITISYWTGKVISLKSRTEKGTQALVQMVDHDKHNGNQIKLPLVLLTLKGHIESKIEGVTLFIKGSPSPIAAPRNPHDFDYQNYMKRKGVMYQQYVTRDRFFIKERSHAVSISLYARQVRNKLEAQIKKHIPDTDHEAILLALLLGNKSNLDKEIKKSFNAAGVAHILAVSGLHIGILVYTLSSFLAFLGIGNTRQFIKVFVLLVAIWVYTLMTGLQPSAIRAAIMFSVITIGSLAGRRVSIYNSIGLSMLLLLTFNPYNIYDVGFQLSHLAVLGIVYIHPILNGLINSENIVVLKIWEWASVSIAAQIATFPLTIYYFHQFPVLFIPANLIIIMPAYLCFITGMVFLSFGYISDILSKILASILEFLLYFITQVTSFFNSLSMAVIEDINISVLQSFLLYVGILLTLAFVRYKQQRILKYVCLTLLVWYCSFMQSKLSSWSSQKITFFSAPHGFLGEYQNGINNEVWTDNLDSTRIHHLTKNSRLRTSRSYFSSDELIRPITAAAGTFNVWHGTKITRITTLKNLNIKKLKTDILILSNNCVKDLEMIDTSCFKQIIIDNTYHKKLANALVSKSHNVQSLHDTAVTIEF